MSASTPQDQRPPPGDRMLVGSGSSLDARTIARYELAPLIGRGDMGEVYRALDPRLRRKVALNVLRHDENRPDAVGRLFRDARAGAALKRPNAVAIHDVGETEGLFYIAMELVNGKPSDKTVNPSFLQNQH